MEGTLEVSLIEERERSILYEWFYFIKIYRIVNSSACEIFFNEYIYPSGEDEIANDLDLLLPDYWLKN